MPLNTQPHFELFYFFCLMIHVGANYGQGKGIRGKGLATFTCAVKDYSSGQWERDSLGVCVCVCEGERE